MCESIYTYAAEISLTAQKFLKFLRRNPPPLGRCCGACRTAGRLLPLERQNPLELRQLRPPLVLGEFLAAPRPILLLVKALLADVDRVKLQNGVAPFLASGPSASSYKKRTPLVPKRILRPA